MEENRRVDSAEIPIYLIIIKKLSIKNIHSIYQLEAALPNFRASQHFDWAIPVYAAYFADEEAQLIEVWKIGAEPTR